MMKNMCSKSEMLMLLERASRTGLYSDHEAHYVTYIREAENFGFQHIYCLTRSMKPRHRLCRHKARPFDTSTYDMAL